MAEEKLLTIREVSHLLGVSEKEVIDLAENQRLPAYRIGGVYLRFKRQQVEEFKNKIKAVVPKTKIPPKALFRERARDFLYFNDFYILSTLIIILILVVILQGL